MMSVVQKTLWLYKRVTCCSHVCWNFKLESDRDTARAKTNYCCQTMLTECFFFGGRNLGHPKTLKPFISVPAGRGQFDVFSQHWNLRLFTMCHHQERNCPLMRASILNYNKVTAFTLQALWPLSDLMLHPGMNQNRLSLPGLLEWHPPRCSSINTATQWLLCATPGFI